MATFQIQLFGCDNTQINQDIKQSFASLLNEQVEALKSRTFDSNEVRDHFFNSLENISAAVNNNHELALASSKYIVFPFKNLAEPEDLQNQGYICSLLDTLAMIAFTGSEFEVLESYVNVKLDGRNIFGIYYTDGQLSLRDSYVRILNDMDKKRVKPPPGFVCIPLSTSGTTKLEEEKLKNIVTDISGNSAYIKPLTKGVPKCVSLSSYIIDEADGVEEAKAHVREVLGID